MRFIDSNVFIYVIVQSPKNLYEVCWRILERVEEGEESIVSLAVIQEVVDWLEYNNRRREVEAFITALNSYPTLRKVSNVWWDFVEALSDMEKYNMDFVDALILQIMKRENVREIYSNDLDFDRVDWVKRIFQ